MFGTSNNHHEVYEEKKLHALHVLHGKKQLSRIIHKLFTNDDSLILLYILSF